MGSTYTHSMLENCEPFVICFHKITTMIKKILDSSNITRLSRHHKWSHTCNKRLIVSIIVHLIPHLLRYNPPKHNNG